MKSRIYTHPIELWFTCIFTSLAVIDNCYWRLSTLDTELTKQAILNYRRELWWVFESKVVRTYVIINIWHVNVYVIRTYPQFYHDLITMPGAMPTHLGANPRNHVNHDYSCSSLENFYYYTKACHKYALSNKCLI